MPGRRGTGGELSSECDMHSHMAAQKEASSHKGKRLTLPRGATEGIKQDGISELGLND